MSVCGVLHLAAPHEGIAISVAILSYLCQNRLSNLHFYISNLRFHECHEKNSRHMTGKASYY